MEESKNSFIIENDKGEKIECNILFTFDSKKTNKNYIVYTDNTKDNAGNIKVYASIYDPSGNDKSLIPIENEEEWKVVEDLLSSLQEKSSNE